MTKKLSYLTIPSAIDPSTPPAAANNRPPSIPGSSLSSSPRQHPTDLSDAIPEEGDESSSESPNEPMTPVSGREFSDFHHVQQHQHSDVLHADSSSATSNAPLTPAHAPVTKPPLILNTAATSPPKTPDRNPSSVTLASPLAEQQRDATAPSSPAQRRATRRSSSSLMRTVSSMFKRSNSGLQADDKPAGAFGPGLSDPGFSGNIASSDQSLDGGQQLQQDGAPAPRWSVNRSSTTTRSHTPPSPGSPALEMRASSREPARGKVSMPSNEDFFGPKKNRASTGLGLRSKIHFVSHSSSSSGKRPGHDRRRASSFDHTNVQQQQQQQQQMQQQGPAGGDPNDATIRTDRSIWGVAEAGAGAKARRMSLSLPDDFTVDVAELQSEFEYQHKLLGRHGRQLGKGATSMVRPMVRKGYPGEVYAVKEFRGKSSRETRDEYEKKIKSEYSIAKSLHHPNIVETVRLCTDHGRWNHVMEYCSEGDLFSLTDKKYLKRADREKDRLCLFKQLLQGLNYLHAHGIAHRDVKLENLLMTRDSKLKITDFGVSEVFSGIHPGLREAGGQCGVSMGEVRLSPAGITGSEPYISPEVLSKAGDYDPRALDVWGAAVVMIHLIFAGALWTRASPGEKNYDDLVRGWARWNAKHPGGDSTITDSDYPAVAAFDVCVSPPALRRVLLQMLNPDPARRSTIADVAGNRWVRNIECCQLESYDDPVRPIDASKKGGLGRNGSRKIFCHNHLPLQSHGTHTLPKMPGNAGY